MNSKSINIIRFISLIIFALNMIILIGNTLFEIPFPDALVRVSGVLTLIVIPVITYTTIKTAQNKKSPQRKEEVS